MKKSHYISDYIDELKLIAEEDGYSLYEFEPTLFKPLCINFERMSIVRRMRYLKEYLHRNRYKVYYISKSENFIGHCVVTPGGRRLKCTDKNDIVLGPYYIKPSERGKGYAKRLIVMTLKYCTYDFKCAYDWVEKTNTASCAVSQSCGFEKCGELNVSKLLRRLIITENGDDNIYRYINERKK